jgi:predicted lipid-binding transport protein (Tim44 family)
MVDSISGNSNSIQDASLLNVDRQQASQSVEKINVESAKDASGAGTLQLVDQATISDAAKKAYESEKDVMRLSRLAQRVKEPYDADKVAHLKNMVDSGRINDYLRSLNTDELAQSILNSPSGAAFR